MAATLPLDPRTVTGRPPQTSILDKIADPGPLGLGAFALTTFFLSVVNAGLLPGTLKPMVLGLALFYGGIVQILAGLVEYLKGNTFGATAFCSYGAFWMSFWYLSTHIALVTDAGPAIPHGVGVFLLAWTIFTAYMFAASFKTNGALVVTFGFLLTAFVCLTLGDLWESAMFTKAGGWVGIATACLAWYTSFAGVMNQTAKRTVLPVWPM